MSINSDHVINVTTEQQKRIDNVDASLVVEKATIAEQSGTHAGLSTNNNRSLNKANYNPRTASILQNTYYFTGEEARQVSAFAKAVEEKAPDLSVNVEPGFLTKIKSLCAKILTFFGNKSGEVKLRKEGIAAFEEQKNTLLDPQNKDFTLNFLKQNEGNQEVLKGFAKVLGIQSLENIKSATELYRCLIDPQLLKASPDIKTFLEQEVWALTKEDVQTNLEKNLKNIAKNSELRTDFSEKNQIFRDLINNGFSLTIKINDKTIDIPHEGKQIKSKEEAFSMLQDATKDLAEDERGKVYEFCKKFSCQGMFALPHPRLGGFGRVDSGRETHLEVDFSSEKPHVTVSTQGGEIKAFCNGRYNERGSAYQLLANITNPPLKFEFDYHSEDGHASNVNMIEYSRQTVNIVSGLTEQGEEIGF